MWRKTPVFSIYVKFISYSGVSREVFWICYSLLIFCKHLQFAYFWQTFLFCPSFWQSFGHFCNSRWSLLAIIWSFVHQKHLFCNRACGSSFAISLCTIDIFSPGKLTQSDQFYGQWIQMWWFEWGLLIKCESDHIGVAVMFTVSFDHTENGDANGTKFDLLGVVAPDHLQVW